MANLTDTQIKLTKPNGKAQAMSDGDKLSFIISPKGNKSWQVRYKRPFLGTTGKISLGKYPAITLKQARKERDKINELLAQDIDPKEYRDNLQAERAEELNNTFLVFAEKWKTLQEEKVKPETIDRAYKILERHFLPILGKVPVTKLTPKMVTPVLAPIKASGSMETIKKLLRSVNQIMRLAKVEGYIQFNPLDDLTQSYSPPVRKNRPTIRPEELPELLQTISNAQIKQSTRCLIEWQLRTLTRPAETAKARWEHIDLKSKLWTIPAEEMKMKRVHKIPITPQMEKILNIAKSLNIGKSVYIFQGRKDPTTHANPSTANVALKRMGYGGKLVAHGLRALASTAMNEQGFNADVIESALAHADKDTIRRAYNRAEYLEDKRKLLCWWSDHIDEASTGQTTITANLKHLKAIG